MDLNLLIATHAVAALYALAIGPINILRRRRDRTHRILGYTWAGAMYYVCGCSFWIVSDGHFSWLHGLSAFTIVTVSLGILAAVRRNIKWHRMNMIGSYFGLLAAFVFATIVPSRNIPRLLASDPLTAWLAAAFVIGSVISLYGVVRPRKRRHRRSVARSAKA
ncbi:DUF2306 domain-containing protein [Arthrobacter sp. zg-Y179]|uniref:DUF2306 domain-containing protein n=1 Tax=Arthrobacter sp. zg-Y179 TaxID=2894188 RepID=UPI001E4C25F8|nr:DUF2306 domain-containing protein [Arthrobacter sp. zg-Y179]MCC9174554.1 DUF2306 domain-containing protein [Arthrobacter sp. zg-Y179]